MGANQVKIWREMTADEASESNSAGDVSVSTPTRPSSLRTLPSFKDPRSPPCNPDATRTPIQVEATPGGKNPAMFDDTPLMQKVLRRGTHDAATATPASPSPVTPVKSLDLSDSYDGAESKENLPGLQGDEKAADSSRAALTSKNK